jgi:hypothetical protein
MLRLDESSDALLSLSRSSSMRLYISEGRTNARLAAEAGESGVASVGDMVFTGVLSGGGIAEGEKSRRFSGVEVSLIADGATLAALSCLAPALCE